VKVSPHWGILFLKVSRQCIDKLITAEDLHLTFVNGSLMPVASTQATNIQDMIGAKWDTCTSLIQIIAS
jgi:hypothetical protein